MKSRPAILRYYYDYTDWDIFRCYCRRTKQITNDDGIIIITNNVKTSSTYPLNCLTTELAGFLGQTLILRLLTRGSICFSSKFLHLLENSSSALFHDVSDIQIRVGAGKIESDVPLMVHYESGLICFDKERQKYNQDREDIENWKKKGLNSQALTIIIM